MEKLAQLHRQALASGEWDLIVVDTPPARSALDFLDAPDRLTSLLDGRFMRLLTAPARGPFRFMSAGFSVVTATLSKVLGAQVLADVSTFAAAFDTLFGGFRERAHATLALLRQPQTRFLVVADSRPGPLHEAEFFTRRLAAEQMPLAGVIVNHVRSPLAAIPGERVDELLAGDELDPGTRWLLTHHRDLAARESFERSSLDRFRARPAIHDIGDRITIVPDLGPDITDLDGLRAVGETVS